MFIAAPFTVCKKQKHLKFPSTGEWANKMRSLHTMEHYLALQRKEILTLITTWMNPEDMMLSEISQAQKDKYYMIAVI